MRVQEEFDLTMLLEENQEKKFKEAMKTNSAATAMLKNIQAKKRKMIIKSGLQPLYSMPESPDYKSCNGWQDANRVYEAYEFAKHAAHAEGVSLIRREKMSEWRDRNGSAQAAPPS